MKNTELKTLSGWSEYKNYSCEVFLPKNIEELKDFLKNNKFKKIITRGHGCSNETISTYRRHCSGMCHINKVIDYDKKRKLLKLSLELS